MRRCSAGSMTFLIAQCRITFGEPFKFVAEFEEDLSMNAVRHSIIGLLVTCLAVCHAWTSPVLERMILSPIEEFVRTAGQAGRIGTFEI